LKSAVEEALERIKNHQGVEGFVICDYDGVVLRRQPSMTKKAAENLAQVGTKAFHGPSFVLRYYSNCNSHHILLSIILLTRA